MPRLPQRHSLPAQTAEIILEMIKSGELTDNLPGERTLASRLQIGRDTLRGALDILESQQAISERVHGKRRTILALSENSKTDQALRIAFVSPKELHELAPLMLVEVDTLRELLNNRGYEFEFLTPGIFHLNNPERKLNNLVKDKHFDLWILYQCPQQVQKWFQTNDLTCIVRGYSNTGINIPSLDEDWNASAFHAGGVLKRNGHQSVGLLIPDTKLAGLRATEEGLRQAVEQSSVNGTIHTLVDNSDPTSTHRALERAFKLDDQPTAFVGTRSRHTLTVLSWLAQHGMCIPKDISYISLCYEHWYAHITPSVTHYHCDPSTFARSMVRKIVSLAERGKIQSLQLLIPEYIKGQSVSKR